MNNETEKAFKWSNEFEMAQKLRKSVDHEQAFSTNLAPLSFTAIHQHRQTDKPTEKK